MNVVRCIGALLVIVGVDFALGAQTATAAVLARESFDYSIGSAAAGHDGGSGWAGPWTGPPAGNVIAAGNTAFPGMPHHGGHVQLDGATRIQRTLDLSSDGPLAKAGLVENGKVGRAGATVYLGFFQRISTVPTGASSDAAFLRYYSFELKRSGDDRDRVLLIGHDDRSRPQPNGMYGVTSVVNNGRDDREPGQFQSLGAEDAVTNTIVVKISFGASRRDVVEVFRNPDESGGEAIARLEGDFRFSGVALARFVGKTPVHCVDEIRLATTFAEALPKLDEATVQRYLAKAQTDLSRKREEVGRRLDELAARGIDVQTWRRQLASVAASDQAPWDRLASLESLEESLGLAAVKLDFDGLLFVKRHAFRPTHIYTEFSDGPYRPGGGIFILSPVQPGGQVTQLFDAKGGICRDPDLSFDGRRVLFSYRPSEDGYYHVYEMNIDGSGLRQLTDGPFHDLDPFYLPDGRIGMTSSRCKSRALCFWVRAATLFVMDADGSNCRSLSANNVSEFTPDVLADGSILYTRWEYMDKSAIFVQSLWSILPDGSRARQIFGNNLIHPVSLLQARLVPGTKKIACTLAAHNGNSYGPLAVVDTDRGVNNPQAILNLVPEVGYGSGCFAPYPLDERWCLVSYGPSEPFGLYLFGIDPPAESIQPGKTEYELQSPQFPSDLGRYWRSAVGPRHLVYRDDVYSCVEAIPLARRLVPPAVASSLPPDSDDQEAVEVGTLMLADVCQGLQGAVPRGTIKYLRVVEEMGHRDEQGQRNYVGAFDQGKFSQTYKTGFMSLYASPWESGKPAPSLQAKWVYGTVPVEADGSAHFIVPAERPIYFSALDEDFNEVQRMRSYIHLAAGERLSCIGCHEPRHTAPSAKSQALPLALRHDPSVIEPPPWGAGPFSYQKLVQPIFDRRCTACHGSEEPAGGLDLSGRRDGRGVPASFAALVRPRTNPDLPPLVNFFDSWWGTSTGVPIAQPLSFGAPLSRLVEVIDDQHAGFTMTAEQRRQLALASEERRIVTTWIDLNCPLWDSYSPELHARR